MKLKGIELNGTYKVAFSDSCIEIYNDKGYRVYFENSGGYWVKNTYDERGNLIYYEDSDGLWNRSEFDERDNFIYYEDSSGYIVDNRVKELTVEEIERLLGYKIKVKGEKK